MALWATSAPIRLNSTRVLGYSIFDIWSVNILLSCSPAVIAVSVLPVPLLDELGTTPESIARCLSRLLFFVRLVPLTFQARGLSDHEHRAADVCMTIGWLSPQFPVSTVVRMLPPNAGQVQAREV